MIRARIARGVLACAGAVLMLVFLAPASSASDGNRVKMQDDCEPTSFDAALGDPRACIGDGETTFSSFLAELQATRQAEEWTFDPSQLTVRAGRPVILDSRAGETHTFTLVKVFAGGFVPILNSLSGNPTPAPECVNPGDPTIPAPPSPKNVFVDAGRQGAFQTAGLLPGRYLFQCCIHPWMRVILTIR